MSDYVLKEYFDFSILYKEKDLVKLLKEKNMIITTAESCTGGMLTSAIVDVVGASEVLHEGYVTYANESKMKLLGVKEETLYAHGAVSAEVAYEMALGAAKAAAADVAVSVTGVAGPDGGTEDKPVGTVYVGFYVKGKSIVERYNFTGSRKEIRKQAVKAAISQITEYIKKGIS